MSNPNQDANILEKDSGGFPISKELVESITISKCKKDGFFGTIAKGTKEIEIGSRYSESRYAEKLINNIKPEAGTFYWMIGIGSLDFLEQLLDHLPKSSYLWIVEPFPEYFYQLKQSRELNIKAKNNIGIILHSDIDTFRHQIQDWLAKQLPNFDKIKHLPNDAYKDIPWIDLTQWGSIITNEIKESCLMAEMAIQTMDVSAQNYFKNFYATLRNQDWLTVQEKLKEKPMIIIGAGPSLFNEYETLRRIKDSVYIGVVDNALKTLVSEDIFPDFVFQVDWQKDTLEFYRGINIPPETVLVTNAGAYAGVVEHWPGQLLFLQCPQLKPLSKGFNLQGAPQFFGTNVGMLGIQFANFSFAEPVCLVGYDMAAPMMTTFHPKVLGLVDIYPSTSRFWSVDKYNYDFLKINKETVTIKNYQNKDVWTAISIEKGRKALETYFAQEKSGKRFFDCSKHGAGFQGVEYKALNEVFDKDLSSEKETIQLDSNCLNYERYGKHLEAMMKQINEYFELMEKTNQCGKLYLEKNDSNANKNELAECAKDYQKHLDLIYSSGAAWIENLLVEMDRRLIILHQKDNLLLEDIDSNSDKLTAKIKQFTTHYPGVEKHKEWFTAYMNSLYQNNKKHIKK